MEFAVLLHSPVTSRSASCDVLCFRASLEIMPEASQECSSDTLVSS